MKMINITSNALSPNISFFFRQKGNKCEKKRMPLSHGNIFASIVSFVIWLVVASFCSSCVHTLVSVGITFGVFCCLFFSQKIDFE